VRAAEAQIEVSRGELLPRITYSVDTGFDSSSLTPDILSEHRGILATQTSMSPFRLGRDAQAGFGRRVACPRRPRLQRDLTIRDFTCSTPPRARKR